MAKGKRSKVWDSDYAPYGHAEKKGNPTEWREAYNARMMGEEEAVAVLDKDNPYNVLGLQQGADAAAVKTAWRQFAMKNHPDHGGNETTFKKGLAAYSLLAGK
jgi:DnaJ-class molecular chaperone